MKWSIHRLPERKIANAFRLSGLAVTTDTDSVPEPSIIIEELGNLASPLDK